MGLANWLTVLRILLIPVFVSLLVYKQRGPALVVFVIAAFTVISGLQYIVQGMRFLNATHAEEDREQDETALFR